MLRKASLTGLVLVLVTGLASEARAQDKSIVVGVEAGLNIADVSASAGTFTVSPDSRSGFWGGGFVDFGVTPIFSVRPEILYSAKGFKVSEVGGESRLRLSYIEIPLLFEARIPVQNSPVRPVVFVGPAISFESTCEAQVGTGTSVAVDCKDPSIDIQTKSTDWGLVFGGEIGYRTGRVIPFVGGRYNLGLSNIDDTDTPDVSVKNRALTFYGGVGIPVK